MSVPLAEPGSPEAATVAEETHVRTEDKGPGYIMGNMVYDPEIRFTPTGRPVCSVRVAFTPRQKLPGNQGWEDLPTEFYDVLVWGEQAERVVEHLRKGDRVIAVGTFTKRYWKDKENKEHSKVELTARDFGPSLLFHAARVDRRNKRTSDDNGGR